MEHRRRPVLHNPPEDLGRNRRLVAREHALAADLVVVDRLALAVAVPVDALDGVRLAVYTATGESRVGRGHVKRAYARPQAAYSGRRVGLDWCGDPQVFGGIHDVFQSHVGGKLHEHRVIRLRHSVGYGDLSPLDVVVVAHLVVLVLEVEGQVLRYVGALRGDVFLDGRGEHYGLERAAGLAPGVEREVEVPMLSGQRPYGSALRLYGHYGRRRVIRLRKHVIRGLDRRVLEVAIHRRMNSQSPELHRPRAQLLLHLASDLLQERRVRRIFRRRVGDELQGLALCLLALQGGDHTLLLHQPQNAVAALSDLPLDNVTLPGYIGRRGMKQTGEHRRLREVEVPCALAEKAPCRLFGAVGAVAEVHGVQVGGQDLVFGVLALVGEGERRLHKASSKGGFQALALGNVEVLHELLGDRGAALLHLPGSQIRPGRPGEPFEINAEVIVETSVLDGDDGPGQVRAETFETDGLPPLGDGDLAYLVPVHVVDVRVLGQLGIGLVEVV